MSGYDQLEIRGGNSDAGPWQITFGSKRGKSALENPGQNFARAATCPFAARQEGDNLPRLNGQPVNGVQP